MGRGVRSRWVTKVGRAMTVARLGKRTRRSIGASIITCTRRSSIRRTKKFRPLRLSARKNWETNPYYTFVLSRRTKSLYEGDRANYWIAIQDRQSPVIHRFLGPMGF